MPTAPRRRSGARNARQLQWLDPRPDGVVIDGLSVAFAEFTGERPAGVWAAPGRVNLIGEHVDYNGGRCLPIALPHRTFCAARRRSDDRLHVASAQGYPPWQGRVEALDPEEVPGWVRYVAGALWALHRAATASGGLDVVVDSDVPVGAGLSSSAALICAVAVAAADLAGRGDLVDPDGRARLAELCVAAETEFVGAPTGGMDQAAALRVLAGHALLLDCRDGSADHVPFDLAASGLALLVIDTRVAHANVDGRYAERRRGCERAAELLGVGSLREIADATTPDGVEDALRPLAGDATLPLARHVVTEMHRVDAAVDVLRASRPDRLGPLLDGSHRSLRDDFRVSCDELDLAVDVAVGAGALGARMTGGGFGGSAIALVGADSVPAVAGAVDEEFASAGLTPPAFLLATAAGPAGRLT